MRLSTRATSMSTSFRRRRRGEFWTAFYGYEVSPILWRKILRGLSAGRVQSVAVRLIAERERQRMAFVSATYWDLVASFAKQTGESFQAVLVSVDGKGIPSGRDFDSNTGKLKNPELLLMNEEQANALLEKLRSTPAAVKTVEKKPYTSKPYPPFTTSTLQQEANRKLGFTARRTMQVAQSLYENGHITYMRTDSTNLAEVAVTSSARPCGLAIRRGVSAREAARISNEGKECARGARGDSSGGTPVRPAGDVAGKTQQRRIQAVRPDLEADYRLPNGRFEGF